MDPQVVHQAQLQVRGGSASNLPDETRRAARPEWLKVRFPSGSGYSRISALLREHNLHTVCEEARCPNIGECFNLGTATFMILGDVCTRACRYCAVTSGRPSAVDPLEPLRLARTVELMGLEYAVITAVNRDDLHDGGASIFSACVRAIRHATPGCQVEVLIPDFAGDEEALAVVLNARPAVLNHNIETVRRLYPSVRPRGDYERALRLLRRAKQLAPDIPTKTGIILGMGETDDEVLELLCDLREQDVDLLTVGQYLQPSAQYLKVARYVSPDEFAALRETAQHMGFRHVEAGPLVRSSYHARAQSAEAARASS